MEAQTQGRKPAWAVLVAEELREQGRTQKWLAAQMGVDADRLYHLTRGDARYSQPGAALLERIALALGKPARWLVGEAAAVPAGTRRAGGPGRRSHPGEKPAGVLGPVLRRNAS